MKPLRGAIFLVVALAVGLGSFAIAPSVSADEVDISAVNLIQKDRCGTRNDTYAVPWVDDYYFTNEDNTFLYVGDQYGFNGAQSMTVDLRSLSTEKVVKTWTLTYDSSSPSGNVLLYTDEACGEPQANKYVTGHGQCSDEFGTVAAWIDVTNRDVDPTGQVTAYPVMRENRDRLLSVTVDTILPGDTQRFSFSSAAPGLPSGHWMIHVRFDRKHVRVPLSIVVPDASECGPMPTGVLLGHLARKGRKVVATLNARRFFAPGLVAVIVKKSGPPGPKRTRMKVKPGQITKKSVSAPRGGKVVLKVALPSCGGGERRDGVSVAAR